MMRKINLLLFAFLLLSGCIGENYYTKYAGQGVIMDLSQAVDVCFTGECICMVCETFPNPADEPATQFYPISYWASTCSFIPCSLDEYQGYLMQTSVPGQGSRPTHGEDMLNYFMFGQGGFGEFNKANPYCNNSLRMPVKWLDSRYGGGEYPIPDRDRARCFVDKGTIPLYILYSRGEAIDPERSAEIAGVFEKGFLYTGPIMLTSEFEFNSSDPETVSKVREQVIAMREACPHCLIALAPRIWDNSTELDDLMKDPQVNASVDLFAYGLNSHDFTQCNPALMYSDGMTYSQYLLYKYGKPSVWAYILFDKDISADGSCVWDEQLIATGHSIFFTFPQGFTSSGVIGGALYSLYGIGSLPCKDCALFDSEGNPIPSRQASWFSGCQGAYDLSSVNPVLFSNAPGTSCAYSQPTYSYVGVDYTTFQQPLPEEPVGSWPVFYSCDACLVEDVPGSINVPATTLRDENLCKNFTVLDAYADIRDLDPALVRTTVRFESGFDPCSVSGNDTGAPCGRSWDTQLYSISDPEEVCFPETGYTYTPSGGRRICAMGLMQTEVVPYTYWETVEDTTGLLDIAEYCAYNDDGKFNPFNPEHSACLGTYELAECIDWADNIIDSNGDEIGLAGMDPLSDEYRNTRGLLTVYLTRICYVGPALWRNYGPGWVSRFQEFSEIDSSYCREHEGEHPCCDGDRVDTSLARAGCCGSSADFINFVSNEQCFNIRSPASGEKGGNKHYIINARSFVSYYLGVRELCGICDKDAWDENINEWAESVQRTS